MDISPINLVIYGLVFFATVMIIIGFPRQYFFDLYDNYATRRAVGFEIMLKELFIGSMTARELFHYYLATILVVFVFVWLLTTSLITAVIFAVLTFYSPGVVFQFMKSQRAGEFNEKLPAALDQLANASKAGLTLIQSFEEVAQHTAPPVSEEFGQIVQDQRLGTDMTSALISARERVNTVSFNLTVTALVVNIQQGGNLPEATETISKSLKEIWRLEQKLNTASSEGRKGAFIICVMPIVLFLMVSTAQPEMVESLTSTLTGFFVLFAAALFYVGGVTWLLKILRVDV